MVRTAARISLLALLLVACAGEVGTPGEALRFLAVDLPDAPIDERYRAPVHAVGGLRPYDFRIEDGTLPPGLELSNGVIQGVPTTLGSYAFTLAVSDANLSSTFEEFALNVVEPPPPVLTLSPPETEVRGSVTLRGQVDDARALVGLSTLVTWDETSFTLVEGSVRASQPDLALFHLAEPGRLQIDLALLTGVLDGGSELFRFELEPVDPPRVLSLTTTTEFAARRGAETSFETASLVEGGTVPVAAPETDGETDAERDAEAGDPVEEPTDDPTDEPTDEPDGPDGPDAPRDPEDPDGPEEPDGPDDPADEPAGALGR